MTDDDLDRIWTEHAGPVFRPKWALHLLRAVAQAAREEERRECSRALWEHVCCSGKELDVVRACRVVIEHRPELQEHDVVSVGEIRKRMKSGENWTDAIGHMMPLRSRAAAKGGGR